MTLIGRFVIFEVHFTELAYQGSLAPVHQRQESDRLETLSAEELHQVETLHNLTVGAVQPALVPFSSIAVC